METPHSTPTSQHTGKSPVMSVTAAAAHSISRQTQPALAPLTQHIKNPGGALESGLNFEEQSKNLI